MRDRSGKRMTAAGALRRAALAAAILGIPAGCVGYRYREPAYERPPAPDLVLSSLRLDPALEDRILALDPDDVSDADVRDVLAAAPAPRIINIHGGTLFVFLQMASFSRFLIAMGYPGEKIRDPRLGVHSYSCFQSSRRLAGLVAWYYEKEGMRPMLIGHSQGGMQVVEVLHQLNGAGGEGLRPWNPITLSREDRDFIVDPLTGERRSLTGVRASFAAAVGAGGASRLLPNQWTVNDRLRVIPDTAEEFAGYYIRLDLLGADWLGLRQANTYRPNGSAVVRTVTLPFGTIHRYAPWTRHLARHRSTREWIDRYDQAAPTMRAVNLPGPRWNIELAADLWTSIKRHWVIEAQRLIRAKRRWQDEQ